MTLVNRETDALRPSRSQSLPIEAYPGETVRSGLRKGTVSREALPAAHRELCLNKGRRGTTRLGEPRSSACSGAALKSE